MMTIEEEPQEETESQRARVTLRVLRAKAELAAPATEEEAAILKTGEAGATEDQCGSGGMEEQE